jgi:hypothetical protein
MTRPRLLLIALENWYGVARLPSALKDAGFEVGLLSEPDCLAARSRYVDRHFPVCIDGLRRGWLQPVRDAVDAFAPDFVVPADERAACFAQFLASARRARMPPSVRAAMRRSLGAPAMFGHYGSRARMLALATEVGLACPDHAPVRGLTDALAFADRHGWPVFLKRDHTYSGQGVRLCADAADMADAYAALARADHSTWSLRGAWRQGCRLVRAALLGRDPLAVPHGNAGMSVEGGVPGQPAFHTAVALNGRWLAGVSAEVEAFHPMPTGPSTRVRLHHDAAMETAARRLVGALGYSGFCGLDFIRRADGTLVFLEFNQRPTPVTHLGTLITTDLCAALFEALAGRPVPRPIPTRQARVALFPQDWLRDPDAPDRGDLHADIPRNDKPLLAALNTRLGLPPNWGATGWGAIPAVAGVPGAGSITPDDRRSDPLLPVAPAQHAVVPHRLP